MRLSLFARSVICMVSPLAISARAAAGRNLKKGKLHGVLCLVLVIADAGTRPNNSPARNQGRAFDLEPANGAVSGRRPEEREGMEHPEAWVAGRIRQWEPPCRAMTPCMGMQNRMLHPNSASTHHLSNICSSPALEIPCHGSTFLSPLVVSTGKAC